MNLLELVSAITGQGRAVTGTGATIKHRLFSNFPVLNKGEKVWEVRTQRKGEVATDILGQAFDFLMFIQCIKNEFQVCLQEGFLRPLAHSFQSSHLN